MAGTGGVIENWRAAMREAGVTHVIGIPDTVTAPLFADSSGCRDQQTWPRVIAVCREGEAFALAAGLWAGGARPLVWIQSTGLFEAGDGLRSVAHELNAPLDIVVGWRGRSGKLNAGHPDTARDWLEPTLFAWRINYQVAAGPEAVELEDWLRRGADREQDVRVLVIPQ